MELFLVDLKMVRGEVVMTFFPQDMVKWQLEVVCRLCLFCFFVCLFVCLFVYVSSFFTEILLWYHRLRHRKKDCKAPSCVVRSMSAEIHVCNKIYQLQRQNFHLHILAISLAKHTRGISECVRLCSHYHSKKKRLHNTQQETSQHQSMKEKCLALLRSTPSLISRLCLLYF